MSAPATWAELQTSVAGWLNRDDLTDQLPEFIALAEKRFNRSLLVPEREASVTAAVSSETATLPTDFWGIRSVYVDSAPRDTLEQVSLSDLRELYTADDTGKPQHYAIQGGDTLVLGPIPSQEYDLILNYYQTIPALGDSQATNWLLTAHPDLYLAGALIEAYIYVRDMDGAMAWEARLQGKMAEIMKSGIAKQHGGPLVRRGFAHQVRNILS